MNKVLESYLRPPPDPCTCKHGRGDHGWKRVLGYWERTQEGDTRCCLCQCETFTGGSSDEPQKEIRE